MSNLPISMNSLLRNSCILAVLTQISCRAPTQITVELRSDLGCDVLQSRGVSLSASSPERAETSAPLVVARDCKNAGAGNSVGTMVLVPSGDPDALVGIRAVVGVGKNAEDCSSPDYNDCIVARREVRFQEHTSLLVKIDLKASCQGNPCDPRSTCVNEKECRGIEIPEGECEGDGCGEEVLPPGNGGAGGQSGAGGQGGKGGEGGMAGLSGQGGASGEAGSGGALPSCGDGNIDEKEECDPASTANDKTCEERLPGTTGSLSCTNSCKYDLSGCSGFAGAGGGGEAGAAGNSTMGGAAGTELGGQGGAGQGGAGQGGAGQDGCGDGFPILCNCQPQTFQCNENFLYKCNEQDGSFVLQGTCESKNDCNALEGKCDKYAFADPYCEGTKRLDNGVELEDCATTGKVCSPSLGCVSCYPNTYFCEGDSLKQCGLDGNPQSPGQSCGTPQKCLDGLKQGKCAP